MHLAFRSQAILWKFGSSEQIRTKMFVIISSFGFACYAFSKPACLSICLSFCLFFCLIECLLILSDRLSGLLFVCLSVCMCVCLSVYTSISRLARPLPPAPRSQSLISDTAYHCLSCRAFCLCERCNVQREHMHDPSHKFRSVTSVAAAEQLRNMVCVCYALFLFFFYSAADSETDHPAFVSYPLTQNKTGPRDIEKNHITNSVYAFLCV